MSITVDDQPQDARELGVRTVGELLDRFSTRERLVVYVTIDGQRPELDELEYIKSQPLENKVVYIETTRPQTIAHEVIDEGLKLIEEADRLRGEAVDALHHNKPADAFKKLGTCFRNWTWTQESVEKLGKLLRLDLEKIQLDNITLTEWLTQFSMQLNEVRESLEARDYSRLSDVLAYEAHDASERWKQALEDMRKTIV
ncbi:MAG TPA: hypothetical protein PK402_00790 [Tepidisphaeraceae bacterium]|nr:hypothetical protein [Tepidisphaeraceae bacterium]